jgi:uncharacterized protein (TIGR00296 family)
MEERVNLLTKNEGEMAVQLARSAIKTYLDTGKMPDASDNKLPAIFDDVRGVFVTLSKRGCLRGCIGHPYADSPLKDSLVDSALSAAMRDPRFPHVRAEEMVDITVEVTILTKPELLDVPPKELPNAIEIGRHGLIVKSGYHQGLLLPQVAPENNFDAIEFLNHTCMKAGLPQDAWIAGVDVYIFEGQIFSEESPSGGISEKHFEKRSCSKD